MSENVEEPGIDDLEPKVVGGRAVFSLILLLFVASGFSSLIYQVVWTRMLGLIFGATTFATATVLAIFMGGLALGSYLAGRVADRIKRPFLWYGILEGIIGLWALIAPSLFALATPIYKIIWQQTHASLLPFSLLRFLAAALILIVPTTCMGATLPLLARFVTSSMDYIGKRVGTLYSANTLGAIGGAATAGFVLLPSFGMATTTLISALINFALLLAVVLIFRKFGESENLAVVRELTQEHKEKLSVPVRAAIITFAVSGAVAMVYEVCWTRTLLMVIGSSTYAFTIMLTSFLIGIFLGSLICSRYVDRAREPIAWFASLQLLLGAFTLISMQKFNQIPFMNLVINSWFPINEWASMGVRFFLAGTVLIPTTLCLGAIFPVVVKACTSHLNAVGRSIGSLYSANTLGAICGAFLAGFVCIPMFGVENTLAWSAVINFALGIILLCCIANVRLPLKLLAIMAGLAFMLFVVRSQHFFDRATLLYVQSERRDLIMRPFAFKSVEEWRKKRDANEEVRFWEDGPCANVGVLFFKGSKITTLTTNGHADASDSLDKVTQSLLAGMPMLFRPDAQDVAVIGWGSGQTVGVTTLFPVRSVEAVELEPAVVKASKFFHHINHSPETDSRVHLQFNDGRNFLLATNEKFDMIISEPSNPWQAGVCNLFTKEYFDICHQRLKPGGALALWVQTCEVPPDDLRSILAAVSQTFSNAVALTMNSSNTVVVASDSPLILDMPILVKLFHDPRIEKEFASVELKTPASVIARIVAASDGLKLVSGAANSDDRNNLEYDVGKTYEGRYYNFEDGELLRTLTGSPSALVSWGNLTPKERAEEQCQIAEEALKGNNPDVALLWANASNKSASNSKAYTVAADCYRCKKDTVRAQEMLTRARQLQKDDHDHADSAR